MGGNVGHTSVLSWRPPDTSFLRRLRLSSAWITSSRYVERLKQVSFKLLRPFPQAGYYGAGNEPSFQVCLYSFAACHLNVSSQTPIGYHYANHPAQSVDRVRRVVFENFDISKFVLKLWEV
jgi:hypothetical protein